MKIGDVVKVYQRPYTREDYEGEAVVRRITRKERDGDLILYRTIVNFPEDGPDQVVERLIVEDTAGILALAAAARGGEAAR